MLSSYFLEMRTGCDYTADDYDAAAGRLINMLTALLSDKEHLDTLTHGAEHHTCHSEIEVELEGTPRELVAKVVVDVVASVPVKFDKAKWTKLVKARPESDEWKKMKINKRQVPIEKEA